MILRKSLLATSILAATLGLTACGGSSSNDSTAPTTPTTPTNSAPTAISITDAQAVTENLASAQVVGTLAATDSDAADTHTFTTDDERFVIEGTTLSVKEGVVLNFEAEPKIMVTVKVSDGTADFSQELEVAVTDEMDYDFVNKDTGESNVHYSGQIARQVMIKELSNYMKGSEFVADRENGSDKINDYYKIGTYTDSVNSDVNFTEAKVSSETKAEYEEIWGTKALTISAFEGALQTLLTDVSGSHKDLYGKIAGNDAKGQYTDWNAADSLTGWAGLAAADNTPRGLTNELFTVLRANAASVASGTLMTVHDIEIDKAYITADGVDLQQLIEKFLFGAVAFSQGADDYLDNDTDGKGLLSGHTDTTVDDKGYTKLEHQWDEGFGYFGAARNYLSYNDAEIAGKVDSDESNGRASFNGKQDTNNDGKIDLQSEYNWGNSTNAAKRDLSPATTDLTKEAYTAFFDGRKLLNDTAGTALTDAQLVELNGYATAARLAWEKAIVATVIHYINDVLDNSKGDIDDISSGTYTKEQFYAFAKHWAEMKGFAFNMQFNPVSPFVENKAVTADFVKLHELMGNAPVISDGVKTVEQYKADLITARNILRDTYQWTDTDGNVLTGDALESLMQAW